MANRNGGRNQQLRSGAIECESCTRVGKYDLKAADLIPMPVNCCCTPGSEGLMNRDWAPPRRVRLRDPHEFALGPLNSLSVLSGYSLFNSVKFNCTNLYCSRFWIGFS